MRITHNLYIPSRGLAAAVIAFCPLMPRAGAASGEPAAKPDTIVAADGSGQFTTVQAAIDAAPQLASPSPPWTIRVKAGSYRERVYVQREKQAMRGGCVVPWFSYVGYLGLVNELVQQSRHHLGRGIHVIQVMHQIVRL